MKINDSNHSSGSIQSLCLMAQRLPGRLNAEQAAALIGCQTHDISSIIRAKLLRPLGSPQPNAVKYFSSAKLLEACNNERWLDRVTKAISQSRWKSAQAPIDNSAEKEEPGVATA